MVALFFWFKGLVSEEPAVITRVTAEIAQIDIPDELEPAVSMDMKVPLKIDTKVGKNWGEMEYGEETDVGDLG